MEASGSWDFVLFRTESSSSVQGFHSEIPPNVLNAGLLSSNRLQEGPTCGCGIGYSGQSTLPGVCWHSLAPCRPQASNGMLPSPRPAVVSHRELWAAFPRSQLQPPQLEADKGVHPEE